MEFKLLGPLELVRDGQPVALSAHKPRALLALLLLEAGRVVPWDRLTAELWDNRPPRSAMPNLRTYAAQLRHAVFDGEPARVVSESDGFRLRLDGDVVDVAEFERLTDAGRIAKAAGDLAVATRAYEQALRIWRGQPLSGILAGPALSAAANAIEEQYIGTVEECAELKLSLEDNAAAIADLRRHVAAYPLRERLRRLLMMALYRAGDPGGALAAYDDARVCLRDHLGMDPGSDLQRLHRAILNRDPRLDLAPSRQRQGGDSQGRSGPSKNRTRFQIAVCGTMPTSESAERLGAEIARRSGTVLCANADLARAIGIGARTADGVVLEMPDIAAAVSASDAVIGLGGSWESLAAIALGRQRGNVPTVMLDGWAVLDQTRAPVSGVAHVVDPAEAVRLALEPPTVPEQVTEPAVVTIDPPEPNAWSQAG